MTLWPTEIAGRFNSPSGGKLASLAFDEVLVKICKMSSSWTLNGSKCWSSGLKGAYRAFLIWSTCLSISAKLASMSAESDVRVSSLKIRKYRESYLNSTIKQSTSRKICELTNHQFRQFFREISSAFNNKKKKIQIIMIVKP